jgi:hypothetical protein
MSEFRSPIPLPYVPDNISIPQFIFRSGVPGRPVRPSNVPFFIEDGTGRAVTYEQVLDASLSGPSHFNEFLGPPSYLQPCQCIEHQVEYRYAPVLFRLRGFNLLSGPKDVGA